MSKIKTTTAYIEVPVSERLPELNDSNLIIVATDKLSRVYDYQLREAEFQSDYTDGSNPEFSMKGTANDNLFSGDEVTAWLEKKENQVCMSQEDFLKAIGDAFDAGEKREYGIRKYNESDEPTKEEYINNLIEQP